MSRCFHILLGLSASLLLAASSAAQGMSTAHQLLLDRGLQLEAVVFTAWTGNFNLARWNESNFTTIDFGPAVRYPSAFMPNAAKSLPWTRVFRPDENEIYPLDLVLPQESAFIPNLNRIQIGNEQDITDPDILAAIKATTDSMRAKYPHVMMHTTQAGGKHSIAEMQNYMQQIQPDLLMFDTYPFYGNGRENNLGGSPTNYYQQLEKYRVLGLAGNDGSGLVPIPVGVFLQTFSYPGQYNHVVSESESRLNNFSAWAFGSKLVDSYVYEKNPSSSDENPVLFTGNGTSSPTPLFYQVAETNRQSLNLSPALVRLISTDVQMVMGQHKGGPLNLLTLNNALPSGIGAWSQGASAVPYLTAIAAQNLGALNDSLRGDVIVGAFKPLDASLVATGYENDPYFMIVNGLSDGTGSAAATTQRIRLDFNFGASGITSLLRLSRISGEVEEVTLTYDGGSQYHLTLDLEGGTGDLFKFNNGGSFIGKGIPGDFDFDQDVDGNDFLVWQRTLSDPTTLSEWKANFGAGSSAASNAAQVPEADSNQLALVVVVGYMIFSLYRRRQASAPISIREIASPQNLRLYQYET